MDVHKSSDGLESREIVNGRGSRKNPVPVCGQTCDQRKLRGILEIRVLVNDFPRPAEDLERGCSCPFPVLPNLKSLQLPRIKTIPTFLLRFLLGVLVLRFLVFLAGAPSSTLIASSSEVAAEELSLEELVPDAVSFGGLNLVAGPFPFPFDFLGGESSSLSSITACAF